MPEPRLVLVEWLDAVYHDLWEGYDDCEPTDMTVRSVGWLITDNDQYIQVAPHRQAKQVRGIMSIPVGAVQSITDLVEETGNG